ncbi:4-azaleucine resistance transporter AzlC [Ilumatobacter fluminis]|uniref:4-azaleucine resistance transporter AzlC n=1 Tax=Ilumatobacter fluminis TaxID=467091 RepID=A0A4R7I2M5_9ACTN|nr:AzlC family ABC transporter permease [Ilumatobacter fluminis]TDT17862.1 4-azaleucine resistance transporter AzlC [Ilumatobacter fluminis]
MSTRRTDNIVGQIVGQVDRRAIADAVPLFIPAIPFGFVVGLAITEGEMPMFIGWLTSPVIFAGAAQLAVITLAGTASIWSVIVAGLVINTRHVMYSAAMAPTFQRQPRWMQWLGPYVLIDQVFALSFLQTDRPPAEFRRYYLSCGFFIWFNWQVTVALGMLVGPIVPDSWRLDFAPAIMFLGPVLIGLEKVPQAAAALVGGTVSLAAAGMPDRLGILVGAIAGVAAGTFAEYKYGDRPVRRVEVTA